MKKVEETRYGMTFEGPRGQGGVTRNMGTRDAGTYYEAFVGLNSGEYIKLGTRMRLEKALAQIEELIG